MITYTTRQIGNKKKILRLLREIEQTHKHPCNWKKIDEKYEYNLSFGHIIGAYELDTNRLVGLVVIVERDNTVDIERFAIRPEAQHQGIADTLLTDAFTYIYNTYLKKDANKIVTTSYHKDDRAMRSLFDGINKTVITEDEDGFISYQLSVTSIILKVKGDK